MTSSFDPETFMRQTVDKPLETEFAMVQPGEYLAAIDDFDRDALEVIDFTYKRGEKAGQPGKMLKLSLPFLINDDGVKAELGRDKVTVVKQLILDTNENGELAFGTNRNIDLGRIRDAVKQNGNGPWSIMDLRGAGPVMVKVVHTEFTRRDGSKGTKAEIDRVVRVA